MNEAEMLATAWGKLMPQHRTAFAKWFAEHGRLLLADEGRGAEPAVARRGSDWTEDQVRKADELIKRNQRIVGLFPTPAHGERMPNDGSET